jgi:hypothetical protein
MGQKIYSRKFKIQQGRLITSQLEKRIRVSMTGHLLQNQMPCDGILKH